MCLCVCVVCDLLILYGCIILMCVGILLHVDGDLNCVKKDNLICGSGKMCALLSGN